MKSVLILSGNEDAHADNMCKVFDRKAIPYFFFSTDNFPYNAQVTLGDNYTLGYNERQVELTPEWSIWNRRIFPPKFPTGFPQNLEGTVIEECKRTIQGLLVTHQGLVVNNPFSNYIANNKVEQLRRAKNIGLEVPDTILTNDPDKAKEFYEKHEGKIIFKMQKLPIIEDEGTHKTVLTNVVSPREFEENAQRIRNAPCYFQEIIPKKYEIRLTVIGEKLFPIAIHSQDSEHSRVDFRRYDFQNVKYEEVKIHEDIEDKILNLVKSYNLHYAAIDLILTPEDRYVFLEINPNGQYLWTEEMSGAPITEYFADYLGGLADEQR